MALPPSASVMMLRINIACHFILSKWQSFTDLYEALRADSNLQWSIFFIAVVFLIQSKLYSICIPSNIASGTQIAQTIKFPRINNHNAILEVSLSPLRRTALYKI
jgi:hypothetical protein